MPQFDEKHIIATLLSGTERAKQAAFEQLFNHYHHKLYVIVRRMVVIHEDTDDILQIVWVKVWQNISKFKYNSSLYTWLYRIAINETLLFLKRKKHFLVFDNDMYRQKQVQYIYQSRDISGSEIQKKLHEAMLLLPEKQRAVFQMRYFDELKFKAIAEIMNLSEGGVKANYHHAVKKIEEYIKQQID